MKLDISNLNKIYSGKAVLNNISINLDKVSSLAVIGPSGGGKSTFLRVVAGLEYPESGDILLDDEKIIFEEKYLREYRKNIGVVFQAYNLFPHLTALENITLPLIKVHGLAANKAKERAENYLNQFKLAEHRNKKPNQLSGGQQQRVAIARAISLESRYIFLDEPTSALDPELTSEVLDMINELPSLGKELILVTHEIGFAKLCCEYTLFIGDGKIIEEGNTDFVLGSPSSTQVKNFLSKILRY